MVCFLRVGSKSLPQVKDFKYLMILFLSVAKMERKIDRRIGAVSAVLRGVYQIVLKRELSWKTKLSIYDLHPNPYLWL